MSVAAGQDTPRFRAVLFDMDGTLIDSEKRWTAALGAVAHELGGELSTSTRAAMVGTDLVSSVQLLLNDIGSDASIEVTKRLLVSAAAEQFAGELEWRPGAHELLSEVRAAGLATALVTSTHRNLVALALETIGRSNFDVLVCGDDVTRTKPDPEPYLKALASLGLPADTVVAIEDSPAGTVSARTAGIVTLAVPLEVPVTAAPGLVVTDSLVGVTVRSLADMLGREGPGQNR